MSWIPDIANTAVGKLIIRLTEPYLGLFRRYITAVKLWGAMVDISYIVAIIAYYFIERGVMTLFLTVFRLNG